MQITKETIEGKFTEVRVGIGDRKWTLILIGIFIQLQRIRVLKTFWRDSHLEQALKDLNREAAV